MNETGLQTGMVLIQGQFKIQATNGGRARGQRALRLPVLLKGVAWRTAFDKLFLVPVVKTSLYLSGEVHLNCLFKKKKKAKSNLEGCPSATESLHTTDSPLHQTVMLKPEPLI